MTDELWTVLAPLIPTCRPHAQVLSQYLRCTVQSILWRHKNVLK